MDALSIAVGTVSILKTCTWISGDLRQIVSGAKLAELSIDGLLHDVESFSQTLQLLKDTAESPRIKESIVATGYIRTHWENLRNSLNGAENAVKGLEGLVGRVNKTVKVLDSVRKDRRLQNAEREIAMYCQRITSYKMYLTHLYKQQLRQFYLPKTVGGANFHRNQQASLQETGERAAVSLDRAENMIKDQAATLSHIITSLEQMRSFASTSSSPNMYFEELDSELRDMTSLQNCLRSASSVVSSASATLEQRLGGSIADGSINDELFPPTSGEWVQNYLIESMRLDQIPWLGPLQPDFLKK